MVLIAPDKSHGLLTLYRRMGSVNNEIKRIRVAGLDPKRRYHIPELEVTLSGAVLMNVGLVPRFNYGDFQSVQYHFEGQ